MGLHCFFQALVDLQGNRFVHSPCACPAQATNRSGIPTMALFFGIDADTGIWRWKESVGFGKTTPLQLRNTRTRDSMKGQGPTFSQYGESPVPW